MCEFVQTLAGRDSEINKNNKMVFNEAEKKAYTAQEMIKDSIARLERIRENSLVRYSNPPLPGTPTPLLVSSSGRVLETDQAILTSTVELLMSVTDLITNAQRMQVCVLSCLFHIY